MKNKGEVWSNTSTTSRESFRGNSTSTNTNFAPVLDYIEEAWAAHGAPGLVYITEAYAGSGHVSTTESELYLGLSGQQGAFKFVTLEI